MLPGKFVADCLTIDNDYVHITRERSDEAAAMIAIYKGQQRFSLDMLKTLNELQKDRNICFCSYGIHQNLLMAYIIASYDTEEEIRETLHIPMQQTKLTTVELYLMDKCTQKMRLLNGTPNYEFNVAAKMFITNDVDTRDCIIKLLKDELEILDLKTDPKNAKEHINKWVEETTKGYIKDLLSENCVNQHSEFIMASGAYFKGLWKSRFCQEHTKKSFFRDPSDDVKGVDFMIQKGAFNYKMSEKLKAHILELPYRGDELSMFIILPNAEGSVDVLIENLPEASFEDLIDFGSSNPRQVEVELPKFSMEQSIDLQPVLTRMGLMVLYENEGEFATLTDIFSSVHWTSTVHKSKIDVDEEGGTEDFSDWDSSPETVKFVADHPFVYFVYDKMTLNILFLGAFKGLY